MTETPEPRTTAVEPVTGTPGTAERRYADDRPNRLNQIVVWVGIVAGVVFIVAVIFFSGFWIGKASGHQYYGWHRGNYSDGQMAPGMMSPGMMGPGQMGPRWSPTTTAPTPRP